MNSVLPDVVEYVSLARSCSPEEVANTVAVLLCDEAPCITGRNILVDGGLNRRIWPVR